ncbi:MAG: hypothetical protein ACPG66_05180 [Flavobacteriales bacterium]
MRFTPFLLLTAAVTLVSSVASGQTEAPRDEFTEFDLDNDLRVILHDPNASK